MNASLASSETAAAAPQRPTVGDTALDRRNDATLARVLPLDRLDLAGVALLLGDEIGGGPHSSRLCSAAAHGSLRTVENANVVEHRDADGRVIATREREHRAGLNVTRAAFAEWLAVHGDEWDRRTHAGAWAAGAPARAAK